MSTSQVIDIRCADGTHSDRGRRIHAVLDGDVSSEPLVVVPPQMEQNIRSNAVPALYLRHDGLSVLRYDGTNHRGQSSGAHEQFTLGDAIDDLGAVMAWLHDEVPTAVPAILATSISLRVVLRHLAGPAARPVAGVVSLVGAADLDSTIEVVTGIPGLMPRFLGGERFGVRKVIRHALDYDRFAGDVLLRGLGSLDSAVEDVRATNVPFGFVACSEDKWVRVADVEKLATAVPGGVVGFRVVPGAGHELYRNPAAAEVALAEVVLLFRELFGRRGAVPVTKPTFDEIVANNDIERRREEAARALERTP